MDVGNGLGRSNMCEVCSLFGAWVKMDGWSPENGANSKEENIDSNAKHVVCYVDTLLNLELPEEGKQKLTKAEIVGLCLEIFTADTNTTFTALRWIMASIVKHPIVQVTLYNEIRAAIGPEANTAEEEDLQKLPYLRAMILEGLRRHPPSHMLLPH
ncbi:hypothetical protein CRG98_006598 [Punica granatum]|uniref:Uncharacterized protein n=1 Tax=Punica granatum TaxID=22663 RepID=A0A2I0KWY4_PUNGR|nr:hypothetical protein CRG98_006598 [Punica granatum]